MAELGFGTTLAGVSMDDAVAKITAALGTQGWGVLTTIDVKATFKAKLDVDFQGYRILGACHPALAHRALEKDVDVGMLMPCNVIVYENGSDIVVKAILPTRLSPLSEVDETKAVMVEAEALLKKAFDALAA